MLVCYIDMRVVVFDLDDTLASERDFVLSGIRALYSVFEEEWGKLFAVEAAYAMYQAVREGRNHYSALEELSSGWLEEGRIERLPNMTEIVAICRNHHPDSGYRFRKGAEQLLTTLVDKGDIVGLITDGRSLTQRNKINALGLKGWIAEPDIRISEEVGVDKLHPASYLHFMARYSNVSEYIYIGDNPTKDFVVANRLGWTTIMLRDPGMGQGKLCMPMYANIHPQPLLLDSALMPQRIYPDLQSLTGDMCQQYKVKNMF